MNLMELRKYFLPEIISGVNSMKYAGLYASNFGAKKALVVTDEGLISNGWLAKLEDSLNFYKIDYFVFSDVSSNPRDFQVMKGAEQFKNESCDIIVALGGGSPIDCAKGIGVVSSNGRGIKSFEGIDEVDVPMPPLICIPTTAGSAADISQFAIITDYEAKRKFAVISKALVPDVSLIDPSVTLTKDKELTAETGMDALVHGIEAYVSNSSSRITDINALESIKLISENLVTLYNDLDNLDLRASMTMASTFAGMAFSNASLGLVHSLAHSFGGFLDFPHGECNAVLLRHVINFNFDASPDKYTNIAKVLYPRESNKIKKENALMYLNGYIEYLQDSLDIKQGFYDTNIDNKGVKKLAENALNDPCIATNPKKVELQDIISIYESSVL